MLYRKRWVHQNVFKERNHVTIQRLWSLCVPLQRQQTGTQCVKYPDSPPLIFYTIAQMLTPCSSLPPYPVNAQLFMIIIVIWLFYGVCDCARTVQAVDGITYYLYLWSDVERIK